MRIIKIARGVVASFTLMISGFPLQAADKEITVLNRHDGVKLAGTLSVPDSMTPKAVVVMATGSGQQNRDEEIMGHKPFRTIAGHLVANGYAVLRMDDRGIGGSGGNFAEATNDDFVRDIASVISYADSCFSEIPVGVIGHSEGGTIAIRNAAHNPKCDFIVTLAAPAWAGDSVVMSQCREMAVRMTGRWDGEALQRSLLDVAKSDMPDVQANTLIYMTLAQSLGETAKLPAVQQQLASQIGVLLSPWYREMLRYDPSADINAVNKPWLALNGSLDIQVVPENLATISEKNPGAITKLMSGHNHLFQRAKTGLVQEYAGIQEDISPETLDVITKWLDGIFGR